MEDYLILNVKNRQEFRDWLINNSDKEKECYLVLKRGKPIDTNVFYYLDAVEEALCFGWIDSVAKMVNGVTIQRFSPRKTNSPWSELNKERARRLIKLGLMTDRGRKVLPRLTPHSFRIDEIIIDALKKNRCYTTFKSFPSLYQRVRAYNVMFYKNRDEKAFEKALIHLINETKEGRMYGEWNDYGRLLDY